MRQEKNVEKLTFGMSCNNFYANVQRHYHDYNVLLRINCGSTQHEMY